MAWREVSAGGWRRHTSAGALCVAAQGTAANPALCMNMQRLLKTLMACSLLFMSVLLLCTVIDAHMSCVEDAVMAARM
jgi:hypothetical protein